MLSTLQSAGWDFNILRDSATIITDTDTPKIAHTGSGTAPSWDLNYPALICLMNGQYYVEYSGAFGMMGNPVMLEATWNKTIGWLGTHVKDLAEITCEQVREKIILRLGLENLYTKCFPGQSYNGIVLHTNITNI